MLDAGARRVLLVEDTKEVREIFSDFLDVLGYAFDVAGNGAQGIEMLEHCRYDLVITDLKMPGVSGLDVASAARRTRPGIEVIVVSGSSMPMEDEQIERLGLRFLRKPVLLQNFMAAIEATGVSASADHAATR